MSYSDVSGLRPGGHVSIKLKVSLVLMAMLLAAGACLLAQLTVVEDAALAHAADQSVTDANRIFTGLEQREASRLSSVLDLLMARTDLQDEFRERDREGLYAAARPEFERLEREYGITHWYFEEPEPASTVFLRVHRAELFGDKITRTTYRTSVSTKDYGTGKEVGRNGFALRVVHPYHDQEGEFLGYMELSEEMNHFLDLVKDSTGDDLALVLDKSAVDEERWNDARAERGLASNWDEDPELLLADTTSERVGLEDLTAPIASLADRGQVLRRKVSRGSTYVVGAFPLYDAAGNKVGAVLVENDITPLAKNLQEARNTAIALLALVGAIVVLLTLGIVDVFVFRRLAVLQRQVDGASHALANGDSVMSAVRPGRDDEIGRFETTFQGFLHRLDSTVDRISGK